MFCSLRLADTFDLWSLAPAATAQSALLAVAAAHFYGSTRNHEQR